MRAARDWSCVIDILVRKETFGSCDVSTVGPSERPEWIFIEPGLRAPNIKNRDRRVEYHHMQGCRQRLEILFCWRASDSTINLRGGTRRRSAIAYHSPWVAPRGRG